MRALRSVAPYLLVAAAIGAALAIGLEPGGVFAGAVGVALWMAYANRRATGGGGSLEPAQAGSLIEARFDVERHGEDVSALADRLVQQHGLRHVSEDGGIVLSGGSQLWTRLLGGYYVRPTRLPSRVELRATSPDTVEVHVADRLGVAIRDARMRDRYAQLVEELRATAQAS